MRTQLNIAAVGVLVLASSVLNGDELDLTRPIEVQVNTFTKSSQCDASIANLEDGGFVVAWHSRRQQEGTYGVYLQRFAIDGDAVGGEQQVNLYSNSMQMKPAISSDTEGNTWAAWESFGQDGSLNAIVARRFSGEAFIGSDEILINQRVVGNQTDVVIACPVPNQATFYWVSNSTDSKRKRIVGRTFSANGNPLTDEFVVAESNRHQSLPCVSSSDGKSVLVWAEQDRFGRPAGVYGKTIRPDYITNQQVFRVDVELSNAVKQTVSNIEPAVSIDGAGGFVVSWLRSNEDRYDVMIRKFDDSANPLTQPTQVSTSGARYVSGAAVESVSQGRYVVTWNQQTDGYGKDVNIFGRLIEKSGVVSGSVFPVNQNTTGQHRLSAASGKRRLVWDAKNDQLRVVWHGENENDSSSVNLTAFVHKDLPFAFKRPVVEQTNSVEITARPHDPPVFDPKLIAEDPFGGFDSLGPVGGDFGFTAINSTGWNPPDPVIAVGPNHLVAMTNGAIAFFEKSGSLTFSDQIEGGGGFWGAQGAGGFVFDPECLYDPHSDRYFVMANERAGSSSFFLVAVSDDDDPNGAWFKYRLDVTGIADADIDSPNFSVDDEVVYLTADFFGPNRFLVYMLRKSDLLVGNPVVVETNLLINGSHSYGVPMMYDADAPAFYMIQAFEFGNFSNLRFHAITDQLGNPQRVTTDVAVPVYGHPQDPMQQGTSVRPELFEARFWSCVYRDGSLWAVHHHSPGSFGTVRARWYEFAMNGWPTSGQLPTLVQSGELTPQNENGQQSATFFPSIWVDALGNAAITTARSSSSEFISMSRAVRSAGDPMGTFQDVQLVQPSTTGFSSGARWGDYSGTNDDPAEPGAFWGIHEFAFTDGVWRTYIAKYVVGNAVTTIAPSSVTVEPGIAVSGGFLDLAEADTNVFVAQAEFGDELIVQVSGNSVDTEFKSLQLTITSRVNTPNVIQEIDVFNFVSGQFETIDSREAAVTDLSLEIEVPGDLSQYITPGSGSLLTRVRYRSNGPTLFFPWRVSIDQIVWQHSD